MDTTDVDGRGYIIRQEHIQVAIEKATPEERPLLERFLEFVAVLDNLERTLQERVQKAQSAAGDLKPALSNAAREAMSQSDDAHHEIDKLLTRKCNRADSALDALKEVLNIAKLDMKEANVHDNWIADDDPTKAIYSELYWKRRTLVEGLREFIDTNG